MRGFASRWILAGVALAAALFSIPAEALSFDATALEGAFVEAVKRMEPAVVHIRVEKHSRSQGRIPMDPFEFFFGPFERAEPRRRAQGFGSGVIVSRDGLVLTNHHVAGEADRIEVKLSDGRVLAAKRVGTDEKTDICLLRIRGDNYAAAVLGDSDRIQVGQWALAVGNPFGLDRTVTLGIISARGRQGIMGEGGYEDFIQTDAAINPGNSGGPLVSLKGEVIGINTAIFSRSGGYMGVGFAIPSNMAKIIMERLLKHGRVTRSWLGVVIQDVTAELAVQFGLERPRGAVVARVEPGSPAAAAGLRRYDVILSIDSRDVAGAGDLRNRVAHTEAGSEISIAILRNGVARTIGAKLVPLPTERSSVPEIPEETPEPEETMRLGLDLVGLSPRDARRLGLEQDSGLYVVRARPGGLAEAAGLEPGDVILEANRRPVATVRDFARVLKRLGPGEEILLLVRNGEGTRLVVLKPRR